MSDLANLIHHLEAALSAAKAVQSEVDLDGLANLSTPEDDWTTSGEASHRFHVAKQTMLDWCRDFDIGKKINGTRWMVSISRLKASGLLATYRPRE
ncbi:hypothetical protein NKG99_24225 [Mesorhizobium sp. M1409]|uniref:hypothetical protein n=1 Tax=unclassified Mesorhizobium TaxID=325217 RepID=UPI003338AD6C